MRLLKDSKPCEKYGGNSVRYVLDSCPGAISRLPAHDQRTMQINSMRNYVIHDARALPICIGDSIRRYRSGTPRCSECKEAVVISHP